MKKNKKTPPPSLTSYLKKEKSWFAFLDLLLVSGLGLGLIPLLPGFWGSLLGLACVFAGAKYAYFIHLVPLIFLTLLSVVRCQAVARKLNVPDHPNIVIDEVIGMWIACLFLLDLEHGLTPQRLIFSLILFRILDMVKPGPIGWIDKKTKSLGLSNAKAGYPYFVGWGVILDDIAAGVLTGIIIRGLGI